MAKGGSPLPNGSTRLLTGGPGGSTGLAMKFELLKCPVGRVRWVGWIEGVSWLVLLGVAMPLKYIGGDPIAVKVVGPVHGGLFIGLMLVVGLAWLEKALSFKLAFMVMVASVIPFGTFWIDRRLVRAGDG